MNTLGASAITCETYGEVAVKRGVRARLLGKGGELTQQRIENSGFDFRHNGWQHARPKAPAMARRTWILRSREQRFGERGH